MIYSTFAQFYDELFDEQMYLDWAKFVQKNVAQDDKILDLAGGAGRLAVLLAKKNYDVTVTDLSEEMLSLADQHIEDAKVQVPLIQANMLDLDGFDQFDVITCFADSLCYLKDITELEQVFHQAISHLNEGGKFIFDVISPYQTDEVYPGYMYNFENEDSSRFFMWASFENEDQPHSVIHDLSFFNENEDGSYQRVSEMHHERTYEMDEYLDALDRTGFKQITVSADFGQHEVDDQTTRWFFICEK